MTTYKKVNKNKFLEIINKQNPKLFLCDENDLKEYTDPYKLINFIDNDGYKYFLSYNMLYLTHHAIVKKQNPYSIYNIQQFIKNNNSKTVVLSKKWEDGHTKIKLKCEKCGREYECIWNHIYTNKKFTCNKCSSSNPYNKKSIDEIEKICRKHGYHIIENTYKSRKNFDIIDKQGYKYGTCTVYTLDKRTNKSMKFSYKNKYQIENMLFHIKNNNLGVKFKNQNQDNVLSNGYIECICSECGDVYKATWEQINANIPRIRCKKCTRSKSNLELIIENYLKLKNINYIYQKRFEWCKNKRKLPFDFYLTDYNTVIEVNGSQHYYENDLFEKKLKEQKEIDNFKKECCIKNNINYVEIPFWLIIQSSSETYKKIIDNIIY